MCRFPVFLLLYSTTTQNEREEMYGPPLKAFPFPLPLSPRRSPKKNSFPISSSFSKDRERKNREKKKSRQNKFDIERFPLPEKFSTRWWEVTKGGKIALSISVEKGKKERESPCLLACLVARYSAAIKCQLFSRGQKIVRKKILPWVN